MDVEGELTEECVCSFTENNNWKKVKEKKIFNKFPDDIRSVYCGYKVKAKEFIITKAGQGGPAYIKVDIEKETYREEQLMANRYPLSQRVGRSSQYVISNDPYIGLLIYDMAKKTLSDFFSAEDLRKEKPHFINAIIDFPSLVHCSAEKAYLLSNPGKVLFSVDFKDKKIEEIVKLPLANPFYHPEEQPNRGGRPLEYSEGHMSAVHYKTWNYFFYLTSTENRKKKIVRKIWHKTNQVENLGEVSIPPKMHITMHGTRRGLVVHQHSKKHEFSIRLLSTANLSVRDTYSVTSQHQKLDLVKLPMFTIKNNDYLVLDVLLNQGSRSWLVLAVLRRFHPLKIASRVEEIGKANLQLHSVDDNVLLLVKLVDNQNWKAELLFFG